MKTNQRLLIIAVVLLLVAGALALVASSPVKKFEVGSPQYVVQEYLKAAVNGDHDRAASYFAPGSSCTASDLDQAYIAADVRADLEDVQITGNTAVVKVAVGLGSEGPFNSLYVEKHVYRLEKTDRWLLAGIPWPLYQCGMVTKP